MKKAKVLTIEQCRLALNSPKIIIDDNRRVDDSPTLGITAVLTKMYPTAKKGKDGGAYSFGVNSNVMFETTFLEISSQMRRGERKLETLSVARFFPSVIMEPIFDAFAHLVETKGRLDKGAAKTIWDTSGIHSIAGTRLDMIMKNIFLNNVDKVSETERQLVGVKALCRTLTETCHLVPLTAGTRVTHGQLHGHCDICNSAYEGQRFVTEMDLLAWDTMNKQCVVIELKTYKNALLPPSLLKKYTTQTWLTWLMFCCTYPSLAPYTRAILVVVYATTGLIQIFNVSSCIVNRRLKSYFPFLKHMCADYTKYLTPTLSKPAVKNAFVGVKVTMSGDIEVATSKDYNPTTGTLKVPVVKFPPKRLPGEDRPVKKIRVASVPPTP
nr:hypothetical protein [Salmonid herpesvirus 1]